MPYSLFALPYKSIGFYRAPLSSYTARIIEKAGVLSDQPLLFLKKKTAVRNTLKMSKEEIA